MLYLKTLGDLHLTGGCEHLSSPRKELALVAYLARHQPRPVTRAELADLLWGTRELGRARQSLRQALVELRRTLSEALLLERDRVSVVTDGLQTDVGQFEEDLAAGRLPEAVGRWGGDFLAGCEDLGSESFRLWLEGEREALRRRLANALDQLVVDACRQRVWDAGVNWARCWVQWIPLEERAHRRLVECLQGAGRIEEARVSHAAFGMLVRRELGVDPSPQYQLLAASLEQTAKRSVPTRSPGSAALFTPDLVGRERAMAELREAWERVRAGQPTTVLVEGEAGIGKTRLCEEFLRELASHRDRPIVVQTRGQEQTKREFALLHQVVATLITSPGLAAASPAALSRLGHLVPELRDRFPVLPDLTASQLGLEAALVEVLTAVSEERPLVLYVDDLPGADSESRNLLGVVNRRLTTPVLFLVTARTGEEEPTPEYVELSSRPGVRRLKLQLLRPLDVEELLGSMLELPNPVRKQLARQLHDRAGGNAFYIIELTAAMVDEGRLVPDEAGTWQVKEAEDDQHLPLPQSIREVITRRLTRLSPDVRSVVNGAAVLGKTFDPEILRNIIESRGGWNEVAVEELIGKRILRQSAGPPARLEFTHEIIWRVAYELLPTKDREQLHRAAADSIRFGARWDPSTRAALSYHRSRAGKRLRKRWLVPAFLAAGVIVVASAAIVLIPPDQRASLEVLINRRKPSLQPRRIVVAPLTNHTGDSSLSSLGALAADWIAQGLMRTTEFEVVDPRTVSIASRIVERIPAFLRDRNRAIAIAEETESGTVVSGDLFREGDSLRVLMQVVDVATGRIVRAVEPVLGSSAAPSRLVSLLGDRVVTAVAAAVDTTSRGFSAALGVPPSYEAYTEISRAWESFFADDIDEVFRRLDRAAAIDSSYMTPLLMRAYVETRLGDWYAVDTLLQRLTRQRATLTTAERAVLDVLQADLKGDLGARLRASRELMRLTPASVEGFTLTASSALLVNRPREALRVLERVDPDRGLLLVAPFYWVNHTAALHRLLDRSAELRSAQDGLRRFPDRFTTHMNLLIALAARGDLRGLRQQVPRTTRDDPPGGGERGKALLVWRELKAHGHTAAAARWLEDLLKLPGLRVADTTLENSLLEGDIQSAGGHWAEAKRILGQALISHPGNPTVMGRLAIAALRQGDQATAQRLADALGELSTPYLFGKQTYARARIAAVLGDRRAAVELLRRAWDQGRPLAFDNYGYDDVHNDEALESLRGYTPFETLMRTDETEFTTPPPAD